MGEHLKNKLTQQRNRIVAKFKSGYKAWVINLTCKISGHEFTHSNGREKFCSRCKKWFREEYDMAFGRTYHQPLNRYEPPTPIERMAKHLKK